MSELIGPYQIVREIGRGGMGIVFLAQDTRLERHVAIKCLPEELADDPDRLARFQREAKTLATLNHPNIATIHGLEEVDGKRYLILEYVEGETLEERLRSGAIPVDEALKIAIQIAQAVEAAHERGIIHRDLKPANIKFTADDHVKVLDFGLAKAIDDRGSPVTGTAHSMTVLQNASPTLPGVILGTAGYLSPEQARGKPVDMRTDIFSFGCILYEMLTGLPPFPGETTTDSIGAVLHKSADLDGMPPDAPTSMRRLVRRCLTKDASRRLQSIGDARVELQELDEGVDVHSPSVEQRSASLVPWLVCLVVAAVAIGSVLFPREEDGSDVATTARSSITLPIGTSINWRGTRDSWSKIGFSQLIAISQDGSRIIQTVQQGSRTSLYIKETDDFAPQQVSGTDGARGAFFSPDGQRVGFLVESTLQKVRLPGGSSQPICEVNSAAFDATWLEDGTIVYSTDHGLWRVSSDGGQPVQVTKIDTERGERGHHFPHGVPNSAQVIFTVATDSGQHAALLSLNDGGWTILKRHAANARIVQPGFLVFARGMEILAAACDPSDPLDLGAERPVIQSVHETPGQGGAIVHLFATSQSSTLAFAPRAAEPEPDSLVWVDHDGNEEEIVTAAGLWFHQRTSPSGDALLFNSLTSDGMLDIYMYGIQQEQINPLTRTGHVYDAEWSPDGEQVCFNALDSEGRSAHVIRAEVGATPVRIFAGKPGSRPHLCEWWAPGASKRDSTLLFFDRSTAGGVWRSAHSNGTWTALTEIMNSPLGESWAQIAPDGDVIAYVGFESGRREIYVRTYPELESPRRVSNTGGGEPRWDPTPGSHVLYFRESERMYQATIDTEPTLEVGSVIELPFEDTYDSAASGHQHYDLSPDGKRFLMVKHGKRFHPSTVRVIRNWPAAFRPGGSS